MLHFRITTRVLLLVLRGEFSEVLFSIRPDYLALSQMYGGIK